MNTNNMTQIFYRVATALFVVMLIVACGSGGGDRAGINSPVYSISGAVSGVQVEVSLSLTGPATRTVKSDAKTGSFSFNDLTAGSYTVAPTLSGYSFKVDSQSVTIPSSDTNNLVFTATLIPTYKLSGTITGLLKQGVLITLKGSTIRTTQSDVNGSYSFTGLVPASYTLKLSKAGYSFGSMPSPVDIIKADISAKDFIASRWVLDSGITANQCYAPNSNVLVSCLDIAARGLNPNQDGMLGADVVLETNSGNDGILGFSYTKLDASGAELPDTALNWSCVKDNISGLIWEVKTIGGLSDWAIKYTNYDSTTALQINGTVAPIQSEIIATTNSVGFKNAVNAAALCGFTNWRLPTAEELQGLVNYGVVQPLAPAPAVPVLDSVWFPNTQPGFFWPSSPYAGLPAYGWNVYFFNGGVNLNPRSLTNYVRLVRAGQ